MQLQSALDLRLALAHKYSLDRGGVRGGPRMFALGVAPSSRPSQYRLAVRAEVDADLPPETRAEIENEAGYETDIQIIGPIEAHVGRPASVSRQLAIGASIGHYLCGAGTLGFFARRNADLSLGFVSNNHVIAAEDQGLDLDPVLLPGPADRGVRPRDVIARLVGDYPRLKDPEPLVDCAFARLVNGRTFDPGALVSNQRVSATILEPYSDPYLEPEVSKIGRSTGLTHGRVSAFALDPFIGFSFGRVRFAEQIEIQPTRGTPFSCSGDSGSLVFTTEGCHPVGLLFAGSILGGPTTFGVSFANPIQAVLNALDVTILT